MDDSTVNIVLIDIQYFTEISYFKNVVKNTDVSFPVFDNYLKTDFLNRCRIAGANGPILLSVPLEKGRTQRTVLKEVRICNDEKWQLRHWRAICSSYNGSPWFSHYSDDLSVLFARKFNHLIDWNLACFQWLVGKFKLDIRLSVIDQPPSSDARMVVEDLRKRLNLSSAAEETDIRYPQVFEDKTGFIPNLSALDLLFCQGPKAGLQLLQ
jgi:hypothetical protein